MSDAQFPAGSELGLNDAWTSGNGRTVLRLQEDRNLVLYKDGGAAWQAPNAFPHGDHALMQDDGNAVVYGDHGALWATNTGD